MHDPERHEAQNRGEASVEIERGSPVPRGRRTVGGRRMLALAGASIIGAAGVVLAGCTSSTSAATPSCGPGSAKLTVQGTGLATGTPDGLTVLVDISVTDPTAEAALADDNAKAAAVIAAFTGGGVTKQNIQTTGLSIQPNYSVTKGTQVLTGYGVDNTITATITDLSSAGSVINSVSGAAGNAGQIDSLSFVIRDTRTLEDQARTDAVHQAVSHARTMAAAAGERLGPVCSLADTTPVSYPASASYGISAKSAAAAVPLEVGSQQASAQVTIVYSLEARS